MKVFLAGFNVDTTVLRELEEKAGKREDLTPEVLSAAYARISRDPRPINEIRQDARVEVERSRKSNSTIIFKMGHHSVAEHAVFNLDILGVSRYCMEELEKFRLCSYTEKSQRYITLDKDFVVPEEIAGTEMVEPFRKMIAKQNEAYFKLFEKLKEHVFKKHADLAKDQKNHNLLEGWAKEDARYITALATESQVGQTINARNLELMLRRFASSPLAEARNLGRMIYEQVYPVAPSIVLFHEANDRDLKTYPRLKVLTETMLKKASSAKPKKQSLVELVEYSKNADDEILAALLHASCGRPYFECRKLVKDLAEPEKMKLFKAVWEDMQFYDSMLREFEYANLTFNIVLSAACFGQLKRHRMSTITSQEYDPSLGLTIPQNIKEIKMDKFFADIADESAEISRKIAKKNPHAAAYILTNAHRKRVLIRVNAREMYHISRLREDAHAQWDIQQVSRQMGELARKVMPLSLACIGGKDRYHEVYSGIFGQAPKVQEQVLPGTKKIK